MSHNPSTMKHTYLLILSVFLFSCNQAQSDEERSLNFDAGKDYFVDKITVDYAQNFSVSYHNNYKVVKATVSYGAAEQDSDSLSWIDAFTDVMVLVQRGTPVPPLTGELEGAHVIEIPVNTIAGNADDAPTRFLALEVDNKLLGLGHKDVYDPGLKARFDQGELQEIGASWHTGPNFEVLLAIAPELTYLTAASLTQAEGVSRTRELGLKAAPEFSWSETSYLGQLEWIKYDALFLNEEAQANKFFNEIKGRTDSLINLVKDVSDKPSAMWGMHSRSGNWTVRSNGGIAELITLAGAVNPFGDASAAITKTEANGLSEGITISDELVLQKAEDIDFIFSFQSTTGNWPTKAYMENFPAYRNKDLYHHFKRYKDYGASDWYQSAPMRPDMLLSDMIKLFHPELLPDHELFFLAPIEITH
ncbi:MAG: ABC transporter substrate-binding protein [Balneola sp.]|nr:MAG: ABC transporter substrate-binding protein [Balneola sp.]